jgi:hypothetical protein
MAEQMPSNNDVDYRMDKTMEAYEEMFQYERQKTTEAYEEMFQYERQHHCTN